MTRRSEQTRNLVAPALVASLIGLAGPATAWQDDDRPQPVAPVMVTATPDPRLEAAPIQDDAPPAQPDTTSTAMTGDRRPVLGGPVKLAFDDVTVDQTIPFIAESTGKVVMPIQMSVLRSRKITLLNDEPIDRALALDLLFKALRLNGIGVVERSDIVIIDLIENLASLSDLSVIPSSEDIMLRTDTSNMVIKIFHLENASSEEVGDQLQDQIPDYATLTADANSNQLLLRGDIELAQRIQLLITELDREVNSKQVTFRLAHADANEIADNILDLYEGLSQQPGAQPRQGQNQGNRTGRQRTTTTGSGGGVELRVTVNALQNSVTVRGEPPIVDEIAELIELEWDLPRSPSTAKVYPLLNSDPIVMRDKLNEVLGEGTTRRSGGTRGGGGGGSPTSVQDIIGGVYKIEALPDTNALLVICKTEEGFEFFDTLIEQLDQPSAVGVPIIVPLKHADAVQLAEELNVLLAEPGAQVSIPRPASGLTGAGIQGLDDATTTPAGGDEAGQITFPWQRAGGGDQERSEASSLIGRVRLVPIVRRNALAVLAPPAQRDAVINLIREFDQSGRQVMIAALIAEVELNDEMSLGVRFSNSDITPFLTDGRVGGSSTFEGTDESFLSGIFDTSTLSVGMSVNFVIQAISQLTNVRIIQQPVLFTADNQEAAFFDGQDIPLFDGSTTTAEGFVTENIDRRPVGVILNVRPRITAQADVDLEIRLQISSIVVGSTIAGSQVIDRRETATHVIVQNEQTAVISGILRDEETKIRRKIPLLGDIPILGEAFTQRDEGTRTTELVAFITPRVVDEPGAGEAIHREYIERIRELAQPLDDQNLDVASWQQRVREGIVKPEYLEETGVIPQSESWSDDGSQSP